MTATTGHVVMFSGGVGSWATASRVVDKHGPDAVTLLFADTKVEDADTYRFVRDAADQLGARLVTVTDGRTPFQVFEDRRWLGNSRLAHCSEELKIKPCRRWMEANADEGTTLYVGIDWTELHRLPAIEKGWRPWTVRAPMAEPPYIAKGAMLDRLTATGIRLPRGYAEAFPHNNCLDQGCVKGGKTYWAHLLRTRPEVFRRTEQDEQRLRDTLGTPSTILTETVGGVDRQLPLAELRQRIEQTDEAQPEFEWGGCGCFTDEAA
jgi:hypothetical protein